MKLTNERRLCFPFLTISADCLDRQHQHKMAFYQFKHKTNQFEKLHFINISVNYNNFVKLRIAGCVHAKMTSDV